MSTELEVWVDSNPNAGDDIISFAHTVDALSTADSGELDKSVLNFMSRILAADDEDAIFAAANAGTTATKEFFNTPFLLKSTDIEWKRSAATYIEQGGFPWYTLVRVTNMSTGEEMTLNGGGFSYMTTMYKLWKTGILAKYDEDGGMPLIMEPKATAKGFAVVLLKKFNMPVMASGKAK